MASKQQNLDFVLEQLTLDGVTSRKMFGEHAIYYRERIVALFCDDQLFVKPTSAGRAFIGEVSEGAPYPGAKPWLFISGDHCEDGEWLSELVRLTASELPAPQAKARASKSSAKSAKSAKTPKKSSKRAHAAKAASPPRAPRAGKPASSERAGSARSARKKPTTAPKRRA